MNLRKKIDNLPKKDWQAIQLQKSTKAMVRAGTMSIGVDPKPVRNKALEKVWKSLQEGPGVGYSDPNRWTSKADVRPSSFPFCPREYVMVRLGLKMPDDFTVQSNHYTEIGKALHYVVQNAFARANLWGLWLCARPSCPDRLAARPISTTPSLYPEGERCPACNAYEFEYEELTIYDPKIGLRGHVDGVLLYDDHATILEIKTMGDQKLKELKKVKKEVIAQMLLAMSPWYGYWHQASTYATKVQQRYRSLPPIKAVEFFLQSRDDPKNFMVISVPTPQDHEWYGDIRSRIVMAQEALEYAVIPRGFGDDELALDSLGTCVWCKVKEACLKPEKYIDFKYDALHDDELHTELVTIQKKEKQKWAELFKET